MRFSFSKIVYRSHERYWMIFVVLFRDQDITVHVYKLEHVLLLSDLLYQSIPEHPSLKQFY